MRRRLSFILLAFYFLFAIIIGRLFYVTYFHPMPLDPRLIHSQQAGAASDESLPKASDYTSFNAKRAPILDRNGQTLAISLPVVQVYANPQEILNPRDVVSRLSTVLPHLNRRELMGRLTERHKQFVYIARSISQQQEVAINNLGIPGIYFLPNEQRFYPLGRTAAHILGAVNVDSEGIAGVEKAFDARLRNDHTPLQLSIDTRIQATVHDILKEEATTYQTAKACAIVMDVHTGEILALVSLPDYEMDDYTKASPDERFNRAVTGLYEPGSTFKLQTIAMGLATNSIHIWDYFSSQPIYINHFHIQDMASDHFPPWLSVPQTMAFSSNPASAHIALDVGEEKQKAWLDQMGFFSASPIELPESARPLLPHRWGITTTLTVGFGHGIAVSPISIISGIAPTVNGGYATPPTLSYRNPAQSYPPRKQLLSAKNSTILKKLLRLDVTDGTGKTADVPGYFVGGKTGTAEKTGSNGRYLKHNNVASFTGIFPMTDPRYAIYVMFDEPQPTPETHGWTTAGWNAAPTTAKIITRIGPMLDLFPDLTHQKELDAKLAIPMHPAAPKGVIPLGPGRDPGEENLQKLQMQKKIHLTTPHRPRSNNRTH